MRAAAPLSESLIAVIDKILPPYWSRSNPIDLVGENDTTLPLTVMEELLKWDGCDAVIPETPAGLAFLPVLADNASSP